MKAIVLYTMRATATVLLGNSWKMVQSFCLKKLQRLILDDTLLSYFRCRCHLQQNHDHLLYS